ncbi:hypothetical protein AMQ84_17865 [Paenibacillus riograndensis]|uniref:ABC transporter ATP-binding protein n=1 Tax=Paenibacillus riograndensis TaxID=483937 RepID=A0A132TVV2_9BACL|nr:ABC transporter ATP-binding protein [Paenibacillus riograndensis]KWX75487.1 hypothetical protein AMQ84_17865 [Paenibacillus riograndensis]KWX85214.1 hypothetical protein AMQ83_26105 [Paenibacillus riograndensis]
MLNSKDYKLFDLISIPFKIVPAQTIATIFYMLLDSLVPAYQTLVIAFFINTATDIFNNRADFSEIYMPIGLIMAYLIVTHLFPSIMQIIETAGRNKLNVILKKEIVLKRARLEYKHIENNETWELVHRVCEDPVGFFMNGFNNVLSGINLLIGTISLLIIVMSSTFITGIVIMLVSIPLFYIAMKTGKENYTIGLEAQKIKRKYTYLADILSNRDYAEERSLFGYSPAISERYDKLYEKSYKIEKKIQIKSFINLKSGSIVALLIGIVIVGLLLPSLNKGELSIGLFISLVTAIFSLVQRMSWQLSYTMQQHARVKEYLKDFSEFSKLSEKENADDVPADVDNFMFHSLEFKSVSFKYPGAERNVLDKCSFKLLNGKNYAFVGENGAGKTTIIKLLVGMYDEYEGDILINDKNLRDYSFAELKGLISVVYQNFSKYALTVKDNIRLGNILKHDEEKINRIISDMNLVGMIRELEFGVDTYIGKVKKNSKDISEGQWQRLAISRLLYSSSKINILDEPTAALDPLEESRLYEMFRDINLNRFTIYITHRLGAAKISDEILVVSEGHIAEQGSHEQLMQYKDGIYQNMFESQKSWYEAESKVHNV